MPTSDARNIMATVLLDEAKALGNASRKLTPDSCEKLVHIFRHLQGARAQLVFCGVGKSGHIGVKLASTFSSLGLKSTFLHPIEALHGDLGRVSQGEDAIFFLSKSGTTEEILKLIPFLDTPKERLVGLLGNVDSPIATACGIVFDCSVEKEACINNQAPTTSTTLALAMGDAMAVLFEHSVNLSKEDFAQNHPGGILGKSLRFKVSNVMIPRQKGPIVHKDQTLREVIFQMTQFPLGGCAVLDSSHKLEGIIVEGDIRRSLQDEDLGVKQIVSDIMTVNPVTIGPHQKAYEALELMEKRENPIGILPVIDENDTFQGFITLHSLVSAGFSVSP